MARVPAATRCNLHDDAIDIIKDALTAIRIQAEAHSVGLAQLVEQRQKQNGRLDRVEQRVWWLIVMLAGAGGATGLLKGKDIIQAVIGK